MEHLSLITLLCHIPQRIGTSKITIRTLRKNLHTTMPMRNLLLFSTSKDSMLISSLLSMQLICLSHAIWERFSFLMGLLEKGKHFYIRPSVIVSEVMAGLLSASLPLVLQLCSSLGAKQHILLLLFLFKAWPKTRHVRLINCESKQTCSVKSDLLSGMRQ